MYIMSHYRWTRMVLYIYVSLLVDVGCVIHMSNYMWTWVILCIYIYICLTIGGRGRFVSIYIS